MWRQGSSLAGEPDVDEIEPCSVCDIVPNLVEIHAVADPQKVLAAAEAELEDDNYHSIAALPTKLYNAISLLVPKNKRLELAWAIANAMP